MTARCVNRGMDKRKVCVFLILVAVGVLCLCALVYMLFYANAHSNPTIKDGGHSLSRLDPPRFPGTYVYAAAPVRS
jgi:hypothetical protein